MSQEVRRGSLFSPDPGRSITSPEDHPQYPKYSGLLQPGWIAGRKVVSHSTHFTPASFLRRLQKTCKDWHTKPCYRTTQTYNISPSATDCHTRFPSSSSILFFAGSTTTSGRSPNGRRRRVYYPQRTMALIPRTCSSRLRQQMRD